MCRFIEFVSLRCPWLSKVGINQLFYMSQMQSFVIYCCFHFYYFLFSQFRIGRGRDAHAPRGCAWAELAGREGLCRRENDEGKILGNAEGTRGNKNPAEPWGLRDENCYFLSVNLFCLQQKVYFLFEVLAWELCSLPHPILSCSSLPCNHEQACLSFLPFDAMRFLAIDI